MRRNGPVVRGVDFKELQKEWYGKLKAEGFKDIEFLGDPDSPKLNIRTKESRGNLPPQETIEYYRACSAFLEHYTWTELPLKSCGHDLARKIWELHSEGLPARKIAQKLHGLPLNDPKFRTSQRQQRDGCAHWYSFYRIVKRLEKLCMSWNYSSQDGIFWSPPVPHLVPA